MTPQRPPANEEELLLRAVARLNANMLGIVAGLLSGLILFLATIILVVKGGPSPGRHLVLLSQYFIGYEITVVGAFVGFLYASLLGYIAGYVVGKIYNRLVALKGA
jgi:hypothetical protein